MLSFLKTSFIHDETAPSESLVLHLKRSFSRQRHLHFFLVFSIARPSPRIVCCALGLHQRQTGIAGNELVGLPDPALAPGRFAKVGHVHLRSISAASWSTLYRYTRVWAVTEPDALRSIRSSKSIFLFCRKCAICDFPSETSATPLPPFRNALRLEKKLWT